MCEPQPSRDHKSTKQIHNKMAKLLLLVVVGLMAALSADQAQGANAAPQLQRLIAEEQSKCATGQDSMACIKERAMRFVDNVLSKDSYTVSRDILPPLSRPLFYS